jgi:glycosyltransferase involved in cell wall biosynthesis
MMSSSCQIVFDARLVNQSGIGTYIQNILPGLSRKFDTKVIGNLNLFSRFAWAKDMRIITDRSSMYSIREQVTLPFEIPSCDVFFSPHYNIPILPIKARHRVVTIHDTAHMFLYDRLNLEQKAYARIVMGSATRLSSKILTDSLSSKNEICKYFNTKAGKIEVIHCGIDHDMFRPIQDSNELFKVRRKYSLPNRYILFVGNIKPHKNLISLVKAFKIISERDVDLFLLIVGKREGFINSDAQLKELVESDAALTRKVLFTGFVNTNELPALYSMAEVFVMPSLYEGFGFPPLEAMSCGCPVVFSNRASLPEICGDAGLSVDAIDSKQIAQATMQIMQNEVLRKQIIEKGFQRAKLFTWEDAVSKTAGAVEYLLH